MAANSKRRTRGRRSQMADRAVNGAIHALIGLSMLLPYKTRVRTFGAVSSHVLGPLGGFDRRVEANLKFAFPDMDPQTRRRICRAAEDNLGRSFIESYSYADLVACCRDIQLSGPGFEALETARKAGKPSILFTGHFGNYAAIRLALEARGHTLGVLYRPFSNPYFERRHRAAQSVFGLQFPRGPAGLQAMLRNIRAGNITAIVGDQHVADGADLTFMGKRAATSTAAARLALKYDAPLVPAYGVRRSDGIHFDVVIDDPVARDTPERMSQSLNDSLERMVRAHPGQWMWTHRRWKAPRDR
ncbi:lauroyl acyltransferase [Rhodobacterales bacterium HKCCSP123]|nr:lauroyl acyltransferase [Rhodobacterales bacterium HKCCSP123]